MEKSDFYVSAVIEPSILFFDGNQDGKTDIFIWADRIRFGMEQNAYLATDTGYQTLGGTTHSFAFEASYCDKYSVHASLYAGYQLTGIYLTTDEKASVKIALSRK
ncbi:MAG: hypothetical protein NC094_13730 [Bacteroidales bacterium]|nr:hypothetical protein [Lachnoclostridium sp.]MCM1385588.1 hypothetical protein [Lachnoclostridium sp.]MCM1466461.1 hypothetical protein [Bacteroidales bacterium]